MMNAKRSKSIACLALGAMLAATLACSLTSGPVATPSEEQETPTDTSAVPPTAMPAPTVEPTQPPKLVIDLPGVEEITLTAPEEGAGVKPQFAWESLKGAVRYRLALYTAGGDPYWAWDGTATSVYLGGSDTAPREESAGPVLSDGMSWVVMAFDGDNRLVGSSVLRPISP